jgi:hypothetical protein
MRSKLAMPEAARQIVDRTDVEAYTFADFARDDAEAGA